MDAVALGKTPCALCREAIAVPGDYLFFVSFIEDPNDPLHPFDNAAFHKACFARWPLREAYLARYVAFAREWKRRLRGE